MAQDRLPSGPTRDPYEVLQVSPTASPEVIRAAYGVLSRRLGGADSKPRSARVLVELEAAYSVLSDPARRADYDRSWAVPQAMSLSQSSTPLRGSRQPLREPATIVSTDSGGTLALGLPIVLIAVIMLAVLVAAYWIISDVVS